MYLSITSGSLICHCASTWNSSWASLFQQQFHHLLFFPFLSGLQSRKISRLFLFIRSVQQSLFQYQHSYTFLTKMVNRVVISLVHHQNPFTPFSKLHTPFLLTLLLSWVCFCCTLRALCVADLELNFFYTALSDHKRAKPDSFRGQTDGPDTCCRLVHPGKFTTSGLLHRCTLFMIVCWP